MKKFSEDTVILTEEQKVVIDKLSEKIAVMIKEGKSTDEIFSQKNIDEGLFGGLVGAVAGATVGPALGRAICKALGIERGILYNFLNSRAFLTAVCGYAGLKY